MRSDLGILLLTALAALMACSATPRRFESGHCARTCIEEAAACKASCLRAVDPSGSRSGSDSACERTCQTQRDTCDAQCLRAATVP